MLDGLVDHRGIQISLMSSLQGSSSLTHITASSPNICICKEKESVSKIFLDFVRNAGGGGGSLMKIFTVSHLLPTHLTPLLSHIP